MSFDVNDLALGGGWKLQHGEHYIETGLIKATYDNDANFPTTTEWHLDDNSCLKLGRGGREERGRCELFDAEGNRTAAPRSEASLIVPVQDFVAENIESVPSWLGEGLVARAGRYSICAGEGGVGKTALMIALALCLAAGKPWLGHAVPEPCHVLYLFAEGTRQGFRERVGTIAAELGVDLSSIAFYVQSAKATLRIDSPDFGAMVRESGANVVFVDPVGRFWDGNENSSEDWRGSVTAPLQVLTNETGTSFVLVDHFGKPHELRQGGQRIRGSGAKRDDAGLAMTLEKKGPDSRLLSFDKVSEGRDDYQPMALTFDKARGVMRQGDVDPYSLINPRIPAVVAFLAEVGEAQRSEIVAHVKEVCGVSDTQAEGAVRSAAETGRIEKAGKRGRWRLSGQLLAENGGAGVGIPF